MQEIIKEIFSVIEHRSDFNIDIMETDKDHIHLLISYPPNIAVTSIARRERSTSAVKSTCPGVSMRFILNFSPFHVQ